MSQQHYPISRDVSRNPRCHNSIIQLVETFHVIQDVNFVSPNMSQQHYPISRETFRVIQDVAISGNRKWQKSHLFSRAGAPDVDTADATSRLTTATSRGPAVRGEDSSMERTPRRRVERRRKATPHRRGR